MPLVLLCYTGFVEILAARPAMEAIRFMINLTPVAATKVKEIMSMQNPAPTALRVAVVGGGCSGFQYHMAFENQTNETDEVADLATASETRLLGQSKIRLAAIGTRLPLRITLRNSNNAKSRNKRKRPHLAMRPLLFTSNVFSLPRSVTR